jgi:hypothetical protein
MYKQEMTLHQNSFLIHITKEYINNIIIEEIRYNKNNEIYYIKNFINNEEQRRFYFFNHELNNKNIEYYYLLTIDEFKNSTILLYKCADHFNNLFNPIKINKSTCTQLCTSNNEEAIMLIKNIFKNNTLKKYDLQDILKVNNQKI